MDDEILRIHCGYSTGKKWRIRLPSVFVQHPFEVLLIEKEKVTIRPRSHLCRFVSRNAKTYQFEPKDIRPVPPTAYRLQRIVQFEPIDGSEPVRVLVQTERDAVNRALHKAGFQVAD
jgi:hypothetical protein